MNRTLEISPETIALIESYSKHLGISVDEYLKSLLPSPDVDLGLSADSGEDFISDMESFSFGNEPVEYTGSYSREDIYADHN